MKKRTITFEIEVPVWLDDSYLWVFFETKLGIHQHEPDHLSPLSDKEISDLFPNNLEIEYQP